MKKILSISVIAAMAALPMAANAAYGTKDIVTTGDPNDTNTMATAKYVKQAYNELVGEINTKAATTALEGVAGRVTELETALGTTSAQGIADSLALKQDKSDSNVAAADMVTGSHLTAGTGVAANLVSLDTNLVAAEGDIDTLQADLNTASTGLKARMTAAETAITNEATTRGNADDALSGRIQTLETNLANTSATSIANTYATKAGVDATLATVAQGAVTNGAISGEISTTSGTLTYVTDWDNGTTATASFLTAANKGTIASNVSVAAPTFSSYAVANTPAQGEPAQGE